MSEFFEFEEGISAEFEVPEDASVIWRNIMKLKEYTIEMNFGFRPHILDIGANIGAYTIWAIKRWKPKVVYCYEPLKSNYLILEKNMKSIPENDITIVLSQQAVEAPTNKLYLGLNNCGQSSFYYHDDMTKEEYEEVESISANELPDCHIVKVDTEGCEIDIVTKYLAREFKPALVVFEYHSDDDRKFLDDFMYSNKYRLAAGGVYSYRWGLMQYVYNEIPLVGNWKVLGE